MHDIRRKLGLGTVQFGMRYGISNQSGQTRQDEVGRILTHFQKRGGRIIDTASAYGISESVLGTAGVTSFSLVSKFMPPDECGESIGNQLSASLNNLKLKKLYGYLAHRVDNLISNPNQWNELQELKKEGVIEKSGVSLTSTAQWEKLMSLRIFPDLIQVPFNYFDRRFESIIRQSKKMGSEVHTRSAFLQGLFYRNPETLPSFFREVKSMLLELQKNQKNLNGKLLSFVLHQPSIDTVIMGVETEEQLKQNYNSILEQVDLPVFRNELSEKVLNPANWPQQT